MNSFVFVGLIYDIIGVIVLGSALTATTDRHIEQLSQTYWDASVPECKTLLEQRMDSRFGLTTVVLGFSLQAIGATGLNISKHSVFYCLIALFLVTFVFYEIRKPLRDAKLKQLTGFTWPEWQTAKDRSSETGG